MIHPKAIVLQEHPLIGQLAVANLYEDIYKKSRPDSWAKSGQGALVLALCSQLAVAKVGDREAVLPEQLPALAVQAIPDPDDPLLGEAGVLVGVVDRVPQTGGPERFLEQHKSDSIKWGLAVLGL